MEQETGLDPLNMKQQYMLLNHQISSTKSQARLSSIRDRIRKEINVKIKSSKAFPVGEIDLIQNVVERCKKMKTDIQERRNGKIKFLDGISLAS